MSKDNIIKNPNRRPSVARSAKREPYQPEYLRLGAEPKPPVKVSPNEFPARRGKQGNFPSKMEAPLVSSGQQRDHLWYPSELSDPDKVKKYADAPIHYSEVSLPPELERKKFSYQVEYEDKQDEADEDEEHSDTLNVAYNASDQAFNLSEVQIKELVITIQGTIVAIVSSMREAEEEIEYLMFNPDSDFHGVGVEQISVFKKLDLKFGISIRK